MSSGNRKITTPAGKRSELPLQDSLTLFKSLTESNIIGIITADDHDILTVNDEFLRIIGFTREDFDAGRVSWRRLTPPGYLKLDLQCLHAVQKRGWFKPFEKEYYRKDGSRVPILLGVSRLTRKPFCCVCFVLDLSARKAADEKLRQSEDRFRGIVETTREWIWQIDAQGRQVYTNPACQKILGYTPSELIGTSALNFMTPESRAEVKAKLPSLIRKKQGWVGWEMAWRHKNGTTRWLESSAVPVLDAQGRLQGYRGADRDVTARRQAEVELRQLNQTLEERVTMRTAELAASEERLQMAQSAAKIGTFDWDIEHGKVLWSPETERIWGLRHGEFNQTYAHWKKLVHPQDLAKAEKMARKAVADPKTPFELEHRILRRDGTVRWVYAKAITVRNAAGKAVRMVGINMDVTARKEVEGALRTSEEKFRRLFSTVADAVLLIDGPSLKVVEANDAATRLYGYCRQEFLGLGALALSAQPEASEQSLRLALANLPDATPLRWHRKKDGTVFPVQISASTFHFEGRPMICGVVRDMTQQIELEQEILSAGERERQRIAQDLHDDLCQQLTGIHYLTETLARNLAEHSRPETAAAKKIARFVQHVSRQTRDLSHGLSPVNIKQEGLAEAVHQLCKRTEAVFGCKCRFKAGSGLIEPKPASTIHLYRITQEAMNNAIKHGKSSRIEVSMVRRGQRLVLKIYDNGSGIAPKAKKRGGGLGMSIMQHRADVIGGTLLVRKAARGGTEVICTANGIKPNSNKGRGK